MSQPLISGFCLRSGLRLERSLLVRFMQRSYEELFPNQDFNHLEAAIAQHFSELTPLWWVEVDSTPQQSDYLTDTPPTQPIGCLWIGNAIDQVNGERHAHIFLIYVLPEYRRRGIGSALMQYAEIWAKQRGDRQISLQVFCHNQPAIALYQSFAYQPLSTWMVKRFP